MFSNDPYNDAPKGPDFTKLRKLALDTVGNNFDHPWHVIDNDPKEKAAYEKFLEMSEGKHEYLEELLVHTEAAPELSIEAKDYAAIMIGADLMRLYVLQATWENYKAIRDVMANA